MIDRATVDKIIDAAQIVDVVGEFVTLRKAGVNYKGLCPFHDDRNPSFMVSPSKNICHCFVCGKGGTPAGFLMEHEQITYPEALRWLAKKYNIEIQEKELTDEERQQQSERESMFIVNEWAGKWFHDILKNDPDGIAIGKQYFRSRGIRDDIIEKFQLGYAPQKRDALASAAKKAGYQPEFLIKTGLCYERTENGELRTERYDNLQGENSSEQSDSKTNHTSQSSVLSSQLRDRYAGRAIFPWFNVSGKVVAFGGRVLDSRTKGVAQKYVNSPDSDIYHKERELYGIYQAKKAIVKEDRVFMVEGYTDVIAMHQAGIENVVANSGTALSIYQIKMLRRFTQNITLLYDGDEAGIHAALRGTDMLLEEGMNVKVLLLPDGDDPDSFARKHSTEELKRYIEEHQQDFMAFKTAVTVEGISDPVKRSTAIGGIVKSISVIPDAILRATYLTELAARLGLKEQTLLQSMNNYIRQVKEQPTPNPTPREGSSDTSIAEKPQQSAQSPLPSKGVGGGCETLLIREVVRHGEEIIYDNIETDNGETISLTVAQYIDYDLSQDGLQFHDPLYNQILAEAVAHSGDPLFRAQLYFTNHPDLEVSKLATSLAVDRYQLGGRFKLYEDEEDKDEREKEKLHRNQIDRLRQRVVHLVMDLRMGILEQQLKAIQQAMRQATGDMERVMSLMQEYKDMQELRNALARRLGKS